MKLFKPFMGNRGVVRTSYSIKRIGLVFTLLLLSFSAHAKDLSGRLGVGFTNEFANSTWQRPVPAISAKYGASKDLHVLGAVGFNTADPAAFTLGGKIFKNIFYETNLNFYAAAGLAYLKLQDSGIEALGLLGAEFFIPGLDSLGFLFEGGVSATNITGEFALKTVGFTFLQAGMHFYF